ncbi:hypothetical protein E1B28_006861 [Marasmius oreades]|uniref:Uncharacterized protein n=1 Tax=Marasmius oreades TaxID=181124 RepID=A0A9P7S131_9AGAR|nr:uncharacterized protein E1B28_006861 [Marasmius oreades]KAG7093172.1 hypothetical protein E1B28_006861 [Marasmius oreades]
MISMIDHANSPSSPSSPTQQAGMQITLSYRLFLVILLGLSCGTFDIDVPPQVSVGDVKSYGWRWHDSELRRDLKGMFVVMLALSPEGVECPSQPSQAGIGEVLSQIVEDFSIAKKPDRDDDDRSGNVFLSTGKTGPHAVCVYGNVSSKAVASGEFEIKQGNVRQDAFTHLQMVIAHVFFNQSEAFEVSPRPGTSSTTPSTSSTSSTRPISSTPSISSTIAIPSTTSISFSSTASVQASPPQSLSSSFGGPSGHSQNGSITRDHSAVQVAQIVGGVVGGTVLVSLVLLLFLFRARNRRKSQQFCRRSSRVITPYDFAAVETASVQTGQREKNSRIPTRLPRAWIARQQPREKARRVHQQPDYHSIQTAPTESTSDVEPPVQPIPSQGFGNPTTAGPAPNEAPATSNEERPRETNVPTDSEPRYMVMHADSGWRPAHTPGPSYVDVPPSYNDAT